MHAFETSPSQTHRTTENAGRFRATLSALAVYLKDRLSRLAGQPRLPLDERLLRDIGLAPGDDVIAAARDALAARGQSADQILARMQRDCRRDRL